MEKKSLVYDLCLLNYFSSIPSPILMLVRIMMCQCNLPEYVE